MAGALVALVIAVVLGPQPAPRAAADPPHPWPKETVKLVVTGPRLEPGLEITDPAAIAANVYAGNFMTATADAPDPRWPRYRVSFYVYSRARGVSLGYAVFYAWNPQARDGFVYLPGRGDADYRLNIGTIMRDGTHSPGAQPARDGHWHYATTEWSMALNARLPPDGR